IDTSGAFGGGNVIAITNGGSISLANITTTGGLNTGGSVTLLGNGVTLGQVDTHSTTLSQSGNLSISSGTVTPVNGPVQVQHGNIIQGGFTISAANLGSNINATDVINVGQGSVTMSTSGPGHTISLSQNPSALSISLLAGSGIVNLAPLGTNQFSVGTD